MVCNMYNLYTCYVCINVDYILSVNFKKIKRLGQIYKRDTINYKMHKSKNNYWKLKNKQ